MARRVPSMTEATASVNEGINNQVFQPMPFRTAQQWTLLPVTDFSNPLLWTISVSDRSRAVRMKSQWTNFFATTNDINRGPNAANPSFFLLAQGFQPTWTTQIWIKEPIPGPREYAVRLRTAWVPPASKSFTTKLYMELTTTRNDDQGTQDVFIRPSKIETGAIPIGLQRWILRGIGGPQTAGGF